MKWIITLSVVLMIALLGCAPETTESYDEKPSEVYEEPATEEELPPEGFGDNSDKEDKPEDEANSEEEIEEEDTLEEESAESIDDEEVDVDFGDII